MVRMHYVLIIIVLFISCDNRKQVSGDTETEESVGEEVEIAPEEVEPEEEISIEDQLSEYLRQHQFEKATHFIDEQGIDLDELFESGRGPKWLIGSSYLTESIPTCDSEVISYLLSQNVDPNVSLVRYGYEEWDPSSIPENMDLKVLKEKGHDGYIIEESPLEKSLACEDSVIFYSLIEAGANAKKAILQGAIKWMDTVLIKKTIAKGVAVDFVPNTDRMEILKMLVSVTAGKQYGEVGYGEGGDIFESDLMIAIGGGNKALVWFMLETGADPNHCVPKNYIDGEYVEPDSAGYYPAATPMSIAKERYQSSVDISEQREDDKIYRQRAIDYKEIIEMLEEHGAVNISKCLGP